MRKLGRSTLVLKVNPAKPDERIIAYAAAGIRHGKLVAFPTETVYGIAASLSTKSAVSALSRVKKRPRGKSYTVHIADKTDISKMGCVITRAADSLIRKYWPGPLTIILRSRRGGKTGFRIPRNKVALELIRKAEVPIVAPSANISGKKPPTSAAQVLGELDGKIDLVIDGGRTKVGIESTVVDMTTDPPKVLREGAIKTEEIYNRLNPRSECRNTKQFRNSNFKKICQK